MIVDPDFMDHWRTGMVADAIGCPMAAIYIMRLWAHCQERKSDRFAMPARGLKAQCKFQGDADIFEAALVDAGFIERQGNEIFVCGWAEKNAALIAAWSNGGKGGRPKKEPNENPRVTQKEPMGNPAVTHGEPIANLKLTHAKPIRVDKRREEEKEKKTLPPQGEAVGVEEPQGFKTFWETWPRSERKQSRGKCLEAWKRQKLERVTDEILSHVRAMAVCEGWTKQGGQFVPAPLVYLNQRRWEGAQQDQPRSMYAGAI